MCDGGEILTAGERVQQRGVRGGRRGRALLFGFADLRVAFGKLQPDRLRDVRIEAHALFVWFVFFFVSFFFIFEVFFLLCVPVSVSLPLPIRSTEPRPPKKTKQENDRISRVHHSIKAKQKKTVKLGKTQ